MCVQKSQVCAYVIPPACHFPSHIFCQISEIWKVSIGFHERVDPNTSTRSVRFQIWTDTTKTSHCCSLEFRTRILFSEDVPPTILIRIPSGTASVEPGGELAVYPGSTLHLECMFSRLLGSPDWTWTSPLGQYLTGDYTI